MAYREYLPHIALTPFIEAYWTVTSQPDAAAFTSRILPDGAVDIICNLGSAVPTPGTDIVLESAQVYLAGTMTRFSETLISGGALLIGIRFRPGAFSLFYNMPLSGMADQCVLFERSLLDYLIKPGGIAERLDAFLLKRMKVGQQLITAVIADIIRHGGNRRVGELAGDHFITQRTLERMFDQSVGVSPKAFSGIVRFQAVLPHIKKVPAGVSLDAVAVAHGYYDHAHLANDIKKYTGSVPSCF